MSRIRVYAKLCIIYFVFLGGVAQGSAFAGILYKSAEVGAIGVTPEAILDQRVAGVNVGGNRINGARFYVANTVVVTAIGGHLVKTYDSGVDDLLTVALAELRDEKDFPDSIDLSTPDYLASAELILPPTSDDVYAEIDIKLVPGWYAILVSAAPFGSGGLGALVGNNTERSDPDYIAWSRNSSGWTTLNSRFGGLRYVVRGFAIPEPGAASLAAICCVSCTRPFRQSRAA